MELLVIVGLLPGRQYLFGKSFQIPKVAVAITAAQASQTTMKSLVIGSDKMIYAIARQSYDFIERRFDGRFGIMMRFHSEDGINPWATRYKQVLHDKLRELEAKDITIINYVVCAKTDSEFWDDVDMEDNNAE
jgi:hypothetical protein